MSSTASTAEVGWLVVGAGRHADQYGLPALAASEWARAVGLCGSDASRTAELAARHRVPAWQTSLERALADPAVTHVYVCSRNTDHAWQIGLAVEAGKHVLSEKPLAATVTAARRAVDRCRREHLALGTGFHLRHNRANQRLRSLVADGAIGEPLWIDVTYLHELSFGDSTTRLAASRDLDTPSKGALAGTGAHAIDLVRWILGDEIAILSASIAELAPAGSCGPQRVVQVSATSARGTLVTLAAGRMRRPGNGIVVRGSRGMVAARDSIGNRGGGTVHLASDQIEETFETGPHDVYRDQFDAFVTASVTRGAVSASGDDGVAAMEIAAAVDEALRTGAATPVDHLTAQPEGAS
jgi:predicted dehydrogenase